MGGLLLKPQADVTALLCKIRYDLEQTGTILSFFPIEKRVFSSSLVRFIMMLGTFSGTYITL